ncbi:MAG TPA: S26 family signal peptidase [Bacteroidales bacterium]|nr:S26 family signal peptidase [Bacteroidales bacterium]HPR72806.1 S26 family signal peptidase [Bacteroidales bacterium]
MTNFLQSKYFKFALAAILYIIVVIWIGNYWLLFGLGIIFDVYVSQKVNWTFWKKRNGKNSQFIEWLDALIFAVVAVTLINIFLFQNYRIPTPSMEKSLMVGDHLFVSKLAYGPRMPNTPIAFPFTANTMPVINGKSWSNLIVLPYKRLVGVGQVKRGDPIVFNFPAGDTVAVEEPNISYYEIIRRMASQFQEQYNYGSNDPKPIEYFMSMAREEVWNNYEIIYRPVDRRDNYVKRCVGIPGDTLQIIEGNLFVNGKLIPENNTQQTSYYVTTNGTSINPKAFERIGISRSDQAMVSNTVYYLPLTRSAAAAISKFTNVTDVTAATSRPGEFAYSIFPYDKNLAWNEDNFGPLWIPSKGSTVELDSSNLKFYERIIDVYEDNDLKAEGSVILINGEPATSYTFKMDYYFMMGDNRHNSADSRYWGFVPEDHIVGKPKFIWLSIDKEARGIKKIRLRRMFMRVK